MLGALGQYLLTLALNAEWFSNLKQAQAVINRWLKKYNHVRPNQALNMKPPVPETALQGGT